MKKSWILILSIILLIVSFLNGWYSDQLLDSLFIFALLLNLILFILYIVCLILCIKKIFQSFSIVDFISFIALVLNALLIVLFPFREAKMNFELDFYETDRLNIIDMIKKNELESDDIGNVTLPNEYKKVSTSGQVFVYQNDTEGQVIGFWIFRGMMSGSKEVIYSTGGEELIRSNETGHPITDITKLKDNWYYVETDY